MKATRIRDTRSDARETSRIREVFGCPRVWNRTRVREDAECAYRIATIRVCAKARRSVTEALSLESPPSQHAESRVAIRESLRSRCIACERASVEKSHVSEKCLRSASTARLAVETVGFSAWKCSLSRSRFATLPRRPRATHESNG